MLINKNNVKRVKKHANRIMIIFRIILVVYFCVFQAVELDRKFFVSSLKELLRGNLGLITQSDLEKARKSGPDWEKFNQAPLFSKVINVICMYSCH